MKNIFLVIIVLIFAINIYSQNNIINDTVSKKRIFLPIEISIEANYTNEIGYGVSVVSNVFSKNNNYIFFGAKYAQYSFHFNHLNAAETTVDNKTYYDIHEDISSFEIPFYYRFLHKSNVFLNIGLSYGINFENNFHSQYYKSVMGSYYEETEISSYDITHYGNLIGGIGFQKLYKKFGYNISLNFMFNSLSLNINNKKYYFKDTPNLSNINLSVAFIIK